MSISLKDTANITTANWGTARNIQIGNAVKSVNGSGNVTWSLSEIGAAPASHGRHIPDVCETITDWNNATKNGWYMGNNAANSPTANAWYFGEVIAHNTNYVFQTVYQFNVSSDAKGIPKYIRAKMNGTWGAWTNVTVAKAVPPNAVFTDTNTWRGVQDNLTSTATDQSLSANQGKVLKGLIDGKAASNHTHSYVPLANGGNITIHADSDSSSTGEYALIKAGHNELKIASSAGGTTVTKGQDKLTFNGNVVYHAGRKPSLSELGAAASNHTHSYLPLSGGTLTGNINFNMHGRNSTVLNIFGGDANGHQVRLGGGAATIVGAGESGAALESIVGTAEALSLSSDQQIDFYTNCNTIDNRVKATLNNSLHFFPSVNATGSIGTSSNKWNTMYANTFYGALSGNASTATKLQTARTINGTSFDGSENITTANWGTARNIQIGNAVKSVNGSGNVTWNWSEMQVPRAYSSSYSFGGNQNAITTEQFITMLTNLGAFSQVYWVSRGSWSYASNQYINDTGCGDIHLAGCVVEVIGTTSAYTIRVTTPTTTSSGTVNAEFIYVNNGGSYSPGWRRQYNTKNKPTASEIGAAASSHTHNYAGSSSAGGAANTAIKLNTARTINGTSFDGSANITTSLWGTARNIQIGNTAKSVNGSANVSWSLSEIGAAASSHTHSYLPLSGGTLTGNVIVSDAKRISLSNKEGYTNAAIGVESSTGDVYISNINNNWFRIKGDKTISIAGSKVYTALDKPTPSEIGAAASNHTHNYLPLSGGTLTGSLKISGNNKDLVIGAGTSDVYINNTASGKYIQMKDDGLLSYSGNKIYHAGDKPTASEVGALATSGGTMSGNLTFNNAKGIYGKTGEALTDSEGATVAAGTTGGLLVYNISHNLHLGALVYDKNLVTGSTYLNGAVNMFLRTNKGYVAMQPERTSTMTFYKTHSNTNVPLRSSVSAGTYLAGNQGTALLNSTASAGAYTTLIKSNSTNGYFTLNSHKQGMFLSYTAKSTVDAGTNAVTKTVKLIDEDGNTQFPGTVTASAFSGNATSATKLQTARTINGTNFDGSGNITTANWGTARNIQIGNTAKSVNGSANVTWNLAEIGALPLSGGTVNGNLTLKGTFYGKNNIALDRGSLWLQGAGGNVNCDFLRFGTNIMASNDNKIIYLIDTSGNGATVDCGELRATQCNIAGKKLFIQSGTPSGVATGDVWIQV